MTSDNLARQHAQSPVPSAKEPSCERERLFPCIEAIMAEKGIKSCTMDLVAARQGMSKRTLYELFESKEEMVLAVLSAMHRRHMDETEHIFQTSANVMEAMARHAFASQHIMQRFSRRFFIDLHRYQHIHDHIWEGQDCIHRRVEDIIDKGIAQGVFRRDVNYVVMLRMVHLQHESLVCMHDIFPPDVTMAQAFEAITLGFLRSIATPAGMQILDSITDSLRDSNNVTTTL